MSDLTEASLLELLTELRRKDTRPLTMRPERVHWPVCPTCAACCRYDEPYWMCDVCKKVVGQDL